MTFSESQTYKMEQFSRTSLEKLREHLTAMLYEPSKNADLKIFTSDGVEIVAHKAILEGNYIICNVNLKFLC